MLILKFKLLNKKALLFIGFALLLFLGFGQITKADMDIDSTIEVPTMPDDGYTDYIIWTNKNGIVMMNRTDSSSTVRFNSSTNGYYLSSGKGYYLNNGNWVAYSGVATMQIATLHYTSRVYYSADGTRVFQLSHSQLTISKVVGLQKLTMMTVLSSIKLLMPLLVVLIVSWIGLRKSWTFLKTNLAQL